MKKQVFDIEIVDLLEGRLPKGVFLRFYHRPNFKKEIDKVKARLSKMEREITT